MMIRRLFFLISIISLIGLGLSNSVYYIADTERSVPLRSGNLLVDTVGKLLIQGSGVHFKLPFWDSIIRWDTRIQHTALQSMSLMTTEDIAIRIDYQIGWRVKEPTQYAEWIAKTQIKPKIFFLKCLNEYLQLNWRPTPLCVLVSEPFEPLKANFVIQAKKMGIEIIDCKIIQKLPSSHAKTDILTRMSSYREDTVSDQVKNAKVRAAAIQAQAKTQQAILLAKAREEANRIKNEGEKEAMQLYTETYSKNQKFARVYQRIISEERSLDTEKSKLIVVQMVHHY